MSLQSPLSYNLPDETARVARAAFPKGNPYLRLVDDLGPIFTNPDFADLYSPVGQPAEDPAQLALVTLFQFAEGLSDRQAADAVRGRIDWKYALCRELDDPGFDHTVLSEFRARLLDGGATFRLFDLLLTRCRERGLLRARGRQRTDSTHVLAAVRALNRLELARESMRETLDAVAVVAPQWLRTWAPPQWVKRYQGRSDDMRLPESAAARRVLAEEIGTDGTRLLTAVNAPDAPAWLRTMPAVDMLRHVWVQNYVQTESGTRWRTTEDGLPKAAHFISSPFDPDARLAKKGTTCWVGYKVSLTETCEDDLPNLITHVETTRASTADGDLTPRIHATLHRKTLLPRVHLVDTGFLDAELLVASKQAYDVDLLGPTRKDQRWQTRAAQGFGVEDFVIDWEQRTATCPSGHTSVEWVPRMDNRGNDSIYIRFSGADCGPCENRPQCTRSTATRPRRSLSIRPQPQYEALQTRRQQETSREYAQAYARRAGVEGTISQGARRCRLRRSRCVGLARTHLGHVLMATSLNAVRVAAWLTETPRTTTRTSPFTILMTRS